MYYGYTRLDAADLYGGHFPKLLTHFKLSSFFQRSTLSKTTLYDKCLIVLCSAYISRICLWIYLFFLLVKMYETMKPRYGANPILPLANSEFPNTETRLHSVFDFIYIHHTVNCYIEFMHFGEHSQRKY